MYMTLRWYGPGYDSVTLKQIRQIPGVKNVITTLFGKQAGERWLPEEIAELKRIVEDAVLAARPIRCPSKFAPSAVRRWACAGLRFTAASALSGP